MIAEESTLPIDESIYNIAPAKKGKGGGGKHRPVSNKVLNRYELDQVINKLKKERDKNLVRLLYLTGCRINELLPVRKSQVQVQERYDKKFLMLYNIICEKTFKRTYIDQVTRERKTIKKNINRKRPTRQIGIRCDLEPYAEDVIKWLNNLPEDAYLFPDERFRKNYGYKSISRVTAWRILFSVGQYPHFIRHTRLTHLVTEFRLSPYDLQGFVGWRSLKTATDYIHQSGDDLIRRFAEI